MKDTQHLVIAIWLADDRGYGMLGGDIAKLSMDASLDRPGYELMGWGHAITHAENLQNWDAIAQDLAAKLAS